MSIIQALFTANLVFSTILKKIIFFWKSIDFFSKIKSWTFWENLLSQSHFTANLLPLSLFWKIGFFLEKTHPFIGKNTQFSEVLRNFTFSVTLYCNFATSGDFEEIKNFFENPIYFFFKKRPILEHFEKSYKVGCFLHQIGCF